MKILYITQIDPRETDRGSAQRSNLLWESLKRIGEVYTFVPVAPGVKESVIKDCNIRIGCLDSNLRIVWLLDRILLHMSGVGRWPFRRRSSILKKMGWGDVKFDCVVTRYVNAAALACAWKIAPLYVDIDDLPTEVFKSLALRA